MSYNEIIPDEKCRIIMGVLGDLNAHISSDIAKQTGYTKPTVVTHLNHLMRDKMAEQCLMSGEKGARRSSTQAWRIRGDFGVEHEDAIGSVPYKIVIEPPHTILERDTDLARLLEDCPHMRRIILGHQSLSEKIRASPEMQYTILWSVIHPAWVYTLGMPSSALLYQYGRRYL